MSIIDTLNRLLGDPNKKELARLLLIADDVRKAGADPAIRSLTLQNLPAKTEEFRSRYQAGENLDKLLPEAFATAIRACELLTEAGAKIVIGKQEFTWDMIPFDVQIVGGAALHRGAIAEMKTGEGKTLVCTLPVYLNAIVSEGVHVVTVNDYLARRDSQWMGILYRALGLTVGCIVHGLNQDERRTAYAADVTYGTNNEFGFDYLRDNMAPSIAQQVQRGLRYAIVDEVDSILIDEARTPLIISQPAAESTLKYGLYAQYVRELRETTHYIKDEKQRTATLTEEGIKKMEEFLKVENIYTERGFTEVHHIEQALRAHAIYQLDVDYVVKDGEIIIVDEFTGRLMPGRRYSHGLHQAIEAKEGVPVQRESKTLATITFQNYFRLFSKLAGMTGTAKTEEEEFLSIYKLPVLTIPTHRPMIRTDRADAVYRTVKAKFQAVAEIAKERHQKGQPVLIGTTSIEKSEAMSLLLTEMNVPHAVLNAKQHEREADIVAKAGERGEVMIATNMAGRGTDIKLGEGVRELGGLLILGTERHEARRIDNQLRGRSGRQGDPGESQFFVSMEDELMRLFGGDRLKSMMERLKVPDDVPLENRMVSRSIEGAQKKVEGRNFDIRRHVVQYDDVMNKHREIMYKRRQKLLVKIAQAKETEAQNSEADSLHTNIVNAMRREVEFIVTTHADDIDSEHWKLKESMDMIGALHPDLSRDLNVEELKKSSDPEKLKTTASDAIAHFYEKKCAQFTPEMVQRAEQIIVLQAIDTHWMDHIDAMAHLREQVAFSGFAQRDPLIEYQDKGFRMFEKLLAAIDSTMVRTLLQVDFQQFAAPQMRMQAGEDLENLQTNEAEIEGALQQLDAGEEVRAMLYNQSPSPMMQGLKGLSGFGNAMTPIPVTAKPQQRDEVGLPAVAPGAKVGRNAPCPCGSGKKFKKCHGAG